MSNIIEVNHLGHTYMKGTTLEHIALKDANIHIPEGEIVAIIGHTGSGKSTLIQHFNGLMLPQEGEVIIDGVQVGDEKTDIKKLRRTVGIVFQNPEDQIFERLVGDDVAYGPFKMGLPLDEVRERSKWAMEAVGLDFDEMKDRETFALSGGQKRKVALAGILSLKPKVLVLDEPTAGLDPKSSKELLERMRQLNKEENMTIVFVSHNMEEVASLANRIYVMAEGTVVLSGTPREIFSNRSQMQKYHIGMPDAVKILYRLAEMGYNVKTDVLTVEEASQEVIKALIQ
ncbi:MAG: energy-coupling factor transporter ATPase [Tuberibacillus sp.]